MCNMSTIGDETLDCMLSGACNLPVDCNFSVAAAVGYLAPDWSHDLDTAPVVQTTVQLSVAGETVESFDADKQEAFRRGFAAVLGVSVEAVQLSVAAAPAAAGGDKRRLAAGGSGIVLTVTVTDNGAPTAL